MSTAHILPPQEDPVSTLVRNQLERPPTTQIRPSFHPETYNRRWLLTQAPIDMTKLDEIRRQSKEMWSKKDHPKTSYSDHFAMKKLDEPTALRPTSADRRNNPHPPVLFLTCHLHNVPGFKEADEETGRAPYKVDASVSEAERLARERQREKFQSRPDPVILKQYKDNDNTNRGVFSPKMPIQVSRLGEWDMDDADLRDTTNCMKQWQDSAKPSLHRYLKYQGPVEANNIANYGPFRTTNGRYGNWRPKTSTNLSKDRLGSPSNSTSQRIQSHPHSHLPRDFHPQGLVYQPTRRRGDYLIHPTWPPTLPHHHIP